MSWGAGISRSGCGAAPEGRERAPGAARRAAANHPRRQSRPARAQASTLTIFVHKGPARAPGRRHVEGKRAKALRVSRAWAPWGLLRRWRRSGCASRRLLGMCPALRRIFYCRYEGGAPSVRGLLSAAPPAAARPIEHLGAPRWLFKRRPVAWRLWCLRSAQSGTALPSNGCRSGPHLTRPLLPQPGAGSTLLQAAPQGLWEGLLTTRPCGVTVAGRRRAAVLLSLLNKRKRKGCEEKPVVAGQKKKDKKKVDASGQTVGGARIPGLIGQLFMGWWAWDMRVEGGATSSTGEQRRMTQCIHGYVMLVWAAD